MLSHTNYFKNPQGVMEQLQNIENIKNGTPFQVDTPFEQYLSGITAFNVTLFYESIDMIIFVQCLLRDGSTS